MKNLFSLLAAGVLACVQFAPSAASGATVMWVGASGDWSVATNWNTGALPGPTDSAVIPSGPAITITHSTGSDSITSLTSAQAFVLSGGSVTVSGTVQINNTFTMSGGTLVGATVEAGSGGRG